MALTAGQGLARGSSGYVNVLTLHHLLVGDVFSDLEWNHLQGSHACQWQGGVTFHETLI